MGTSLDAVSLMRLAGLEPDEDQARVLTTPGDHLLLCHRQWGKSSVVAAKAFERACSAPHQLVLLISRSMRQSGELFRKVKHFYNLSHPMPLIQDSVLSMELNNHSRIISLPGSEDTIVGFSAVDLLIVDEAARVPDAVYYVTRPMLGMSGGDLIALSTPWGKRGWFYEAWQGQHGTGQAMTPEAIIDTIQGLGMAVTLEDLEHIPDVDFADWQRTQVVATENPRLPLTFLARERHEIPDIWFRQEYLCEFVDPSGSVFRYQDIEAMLTDDVVPLFGPKRDAVLSEKVLPLFGGQPL